MGQVYMWRSSGQGQGHRNKNGRKSLLPPCKTLTGSNSAVLTMADRMVCCQLTRLKWLRLDPHSSTKPFRFLPKLPPLLLFLPSFLPTSSLKHLSYPQRVQAKPGQYLVHWAKQVASGDSNFGAVHKIISKVHKPPKVSMENIAKRTQSA